MTHNPAYYPNESPKRIHMEITSITQGLLDYLFADPNRQLGVVGRNNYMFNVSLGGSSSMTFDNGEMRIILDENVTPETFTPISYDLSLDYGEEDYNELAARVESVINGVPIAMA